MAFAIAVFVVALALIASERVDRTKIALLGATHRRPRRHARSGAGDRGDRLQHDRPARGDDDHGPRHRDHRRLHVAGDPRRPDVTRRADPRRPRAGGHDRGAVGVPGQRHDDPADRPDHLPARRRARRQPRAADHHRDRRLQHRRHRDADRRPAEHPDRRPHRPVLRRVHRQPGPDRDRRPGAHDPGPLLRVPLTAADRPRRPQARACSLDAAKSIEDPAEAWRTVPILLVTILVFFIHKPLHLEPATVALAGAAVMLLVSPPVAARLDLLDRVADAVLPDRPVRDGRRARGDRRAGRGRRRHRRRSPAATAPPSCSASSGSPRSAPGSSTTSPSPRR